MLPTLPPVVALIVGLVVLVGGGELLVRGASNLAAAARISPLVIGLTVVAFGTSSPELAVSMRSAFAGQADFAVGNVVGSNICNVLLILGLSALIAPLVVSAQLVRLDVPLMIGASVIAAIRGERDIAVGNVVGSNLFNILCVLGLSALVAPNEISVAPAALRFDIPVMIAVAVACLPVFFTGHLIARWEGAMFFCCYLAYIAYLVLAATQAAVTREFEIVMGVFVIPLTVVTLVVGVVRAVRTGSGALEDEQR